MNIRIAKKILDKWGKEKVRIHLLRRAIKYAAKFPQHRAWRKWDKRLFENCSGEWVGLWLGEDLDEWPE